MIKIFNKQDILKGFNFWAIIVCLFFTIFLSVFVNYSQYYFIYIIGTFIFIVNHIIIEKGWLKLGFVLFVICSNSIMLIFDGGILSPAIGFVFYFSLLLCNLIVTNFDRRLEQLFSVLLTLTCICLTTFTDLTPKLATRLYLNEHQAIVAYFNTFAAILMTVIIAYVLSRSAQQSQQDLLESQKILNKNEKLLDSINQNIDVAICRIDVASNKLIYVNNAAVRVFGYDSIEEILSLSPCVFYKDSLGRAEIMAQLEKNESVSNIEIKCKRKDGSDFWGLLTSNKTKDDDGKVVYDDTLRDISEIKRLQEELISAKEQAEKASLAKSQFLSTISHEIRTPMNAVIGASSLLLADEQRPEQIENLQLLKSAGSNLMRLINNVLDFSKIELDKVEFEQLPVDLSLLINEAISANIQEAQKKNISIKFVSEKASYQYILDPIRFVQVINNLLSNAVKFTSEGGVVLSVKTVAKTHEYDTITISVKDTGIGVAEDHKNKIFDSFSQENIDTTRKYGGTGLGLAITKRILQKLDSTIELITEKGKGSTFSFSLNLKKHDEQNQPLIVQQNPPVSIEGMYVLVVEDNKMNTLIITKFLSRWKITYDCCENGREALDKLQQSTYDLILMDLHMPDMDGFQTTIAIRELNQHVPIFALTADVFAEVRTKALACGMNDFISKPFDPIELFNKIALLRC